VNLDKFLQRAILAAPAVVLQATYANGFGVIRDLGRYGIPSLALDPNPRALGFLSRHAHGMICPDPHPDEEAFVTFLEDVGRRLPQKGVLFPTHDEYIWPVARHAERLAAYFHIPFSRWETMRRVADKEQQMRAAWRAEVDTPKTIFVTAADQLEEAGAEVTFPAIFKPIDGVEFKRRFGRQILMITSRDDLPRAWEMVDGCGAMMLQEIIPGGDDELYTVGSYLDERSRPLAVFTGRKIRQHPKNFGSARFAESIWIQDLADAGLRLLTELHYHGISQVEFKRDPRDGRFKFMEVNGRHWLWHSLAAACGVNLSYAAYRDALGDPFLAPRQIDGPRWILTFTDLFASRMDIARGDLSFADWVTSLRGTKIDGLLTWRDPRPGAAHACRMVQRAIRGRTGRRGRQVEV
jgi:D-aspartate ligase